MARFLKTCFILVIFLTVSGTFVTFPKQEHQFKFLDHLPTITKEYPGYEVYPPIKFEVPVNLGEFPQIVPVEHLLQSREMYAHQEFFLYGKLSYGKGVGYELLSASAHGHLSDYEGLEIIFPLNQLQPCLGKVVYLRVKTNWPTYTYVYGVDTIIAQPNVKNPAYVEVLAASDVFEPVWEDYYKEQPGYIEVFMSTIYANSDRAINLDMGEWVDTTPLEPSCLYFAEKKAD